MPALTSITRRTTPSPWEVPRRRVALSDCYFYHTTELPDGRVLEGQWDLRGRFADYVGHAPVRGKRVLDVGTASGFLTFEAEACGAAEIVSFDLDTAERQHLLPFRDSLYVRDHAEWVRIQTGAFEGWKNAYWYTHGARVSKAKAAYGDVYALPDGIGTFDLVILGSILEHLADPVGAIGSIARVASDIIVINTDVMEGDGALARFNGHPDFPERNYIFWTYTIETYARILKICGFRIDGVREDTYLNRSALPSGDRLHQVPRSTIVARRI